MQTWQVLCGIAEAVLAFWGTYWLMHPEHKAERMALILSLGRRRRKLLYDPAVHPNDIAELQHRLDSHRLITAMYKKELQDQQGRLRDGMALYYGQPSHRKWPQLPLILPNAEGLLGHNVTPWLRDGVSEKATPEYEAGIKRRAEARRLRAKYGMDSNEWKRGL